MKLFRRMATFQRSRYWDYLVEKLACAGNEYSRLSLVWIRQGSSAIPHDTTSRLTGITSLTTKSSAFINYYDYHRRSLTGMAQ